MSAMKDIFISYAAEDRAIAQRLAAGLEGSGLSVWWDRQIQVGSDWDKTIEDALDGAKCAVVLWTGHAKSSRWVRAEARQALKEEKVVPVMLEANAIPLAFTGIQSLRFLGWGGAAGSQEFEILLGVIRAKIEGKSIELPEASSTKASVVGKLVALLGIKAMVGSVLALLLLASSFLRINPDVTVHVQTARIEFSVLSELEDKRLTDALSFDALTVQNIGKISLSPERLLVADPRDYDMASDSYPPKAWLDLPANGRTIQFESDKSGISPEVTIESTEGKGPVAGVLDGIILTQDAVVTLEVTEDNAVIWSMRTEKGRQRIVLSNVQAVEFIESGLRLPDDFSLPITQDQELTYQALYEDKPGTIEIVGHDEELVIVLKETGGQPKDLVSNSVLPVQSVDFSWQDPGTGERKIPEGFEGTVEYRSPQGMPSMKIENNSFLTLERLEHFEITSISVDPVSHLLAVDLQGEVGYIKTGTRQNPRDLRPTLFDQIRFSPLFEPVRKLIGL